MEGLHREGGGVGAGPQVTNAHRCVPPCQYKGTGIIPSFKGVPVSLMVVCVLPDPILAAVRFLTLRGPLSYVLMGGKGPFSMADQVPTIPRQGRPWAL